MSNMCLHLLLLSVKPHALIQKGVVVYSKMLKRHWNYFCLAMVDSEKGKIFYVSNIKFHNDDDDQVLILEFYGNSAVRRFAWCDIRTK